MNLLIEQRTSSIPSSNTQSQSSEQSNDNDMNNSSSTASSLVLKIKRSTAKQQVNDSLSRSSPMPDDEDDDEDNRQSARSSSAQNSRLKRPNSITSVRRPSSPAFNGKQQQQGTKRSVTIDNNNNDLPSHLEEISARKRFKPDDCSSSSNKVDASVETVSVGLATEPDHLGPCEPGTSVVLEGIVWNETDSGVLVVNVTWRGKTYVGTLLDSTKQDWACPRLTCDSPTSDFDGRTNIKSSRSKRTSAGANTRSSTQNQAVSSFQQITSIILSSGIDDRRLRHNIKSRQSKRINQLSTSNADEHSNSGSPLASPHRTNQSFFSSETTTTVNNAKGSTTSNGEPQLIPCSESNCHKRFASKVALSYHLSNAHPKSSNMSNTVSQASTRDEEDVAHILANVAHYARRSSPPSSVRSSPEHTSTSQTSSLTWPCQQISSKLVQPAALNNDERTICPNSIRSPLATTILDTNTPNEQNDSKSTFTPTDSTNVRLQEDIQTTSPVSILQSNQSTLNSSIIDQNNTIVERQSSPIPSASTFVPITLPSTTIPPTSSSPAYSDISDEDPATNPHEQNFPPSTINLLASTNGKLGDNGSKISSNGYLPSNGGLTHPDLSSPAWTTQLLFQPFGPYMNQSGLVPPATNIVSTTNKESIKGSPSNTPNSLNSKTSCPSTNGTSNDSTTVKNILDSRRSTPTSTSSSSTTATIKSSSSPPIGLYHFHTNGISADNKYSPSIINTLTSPNENLLHPSNLTATTTVTPATNVLSTLKPMDILEFSLNPSHSTTSNGPYPHPSSLHPSR